MKTKMIILSLSMGLSATSFAEQCPSVTDWSHQPGQPWQLSKQASQNGWLVYANSDNTSNYTTVPAHALLISMIDSYGLTECIYYLDGSLAGSIVLAYSKKEVDLTSLAQPPYEDMGQALYQCTTQAVTPDVCRWKWKS